MKEWLSLVVGHGWSWKVLLWMLRSLQMITTAPLAEEEMRMIMFCLWNLKHKIKLPKHAFRLMMMFSSPWLLLATSAEIWGKWKCFHSSGYRLIELKNGIEALLVSNLDQKKQKAACSCCVQARLRKASYPHIPLHLHPSTEGGIL